jgi:hypothetical protein
MIDWILCSWNWDWFSDFSRTSNYASLDITLFWGVIRQKPGILSDGHWHYVGNFYQTRADHDKDRAN